MSQIDIDFARGKPLYPAWVRLGLLLTGLVMLGLTWTYALRLQDAITDQSVLLQTKQQASVSNNIDPQFIEVVAVASRTQWKLHIPWLPMLSNLEKVKSLHAGVKLLSVTPNFNKAEIILVGEAEKFENITAFLEDLKKATQFSDAVLQSQYIHEQENGFDLTYNFSAQLTWRLEGPK